MIIVLDTNVLMRAIFSDDQHGKNIMRLHNKGSISIVTSSCIDKEWTSIFRLMCCRIIDDTPPEDVVRDKNNWMRFIKTFVDFVGPLKRVHITDVKKYSPDKDDDMFFQCAVCGNADMIISYNSDHLNIFDNKYKNKQGKKIRVLSPYQAYIIISGKEKGISVRY